MIEFPDFIGSLANGRYDNIVTNSHVFIDDDLAYSAIAADAQRNSRWVRRLSVFIEIRAHYNGSRNHRTLTDFGPQSDHRMTDTVTGNNASILEQAMLQMALVDFRRR